MRFLEESARLVDNVNADTAIIGAGIGGLVLGGLLGKAGISYSIYEQAPKLEALGAGINFHANGINVFEYLSGDRISSAGVRVKRRLYRRWDNGDIVKTFDMADRAIRYGAASRAFHRGELHAALLKCVAPERLNLNRRLCSLYAGSDGVELKFEEGPSVRAKLLVGADGLHSVVRRHIEGFPQPRFSGRVAYRAIVPAEALAGLPEIADYMRWWDRHGSTDRYVLLYAMDEDRHRYCMVAVHSEAWLGREISPHVVDRDTLTERFSDIDPKLLAILGQLENIIKWPLMVAYPGNPPWYDRAVTLLGDAGHPMTPHIGQGGGMAVEDAAILARCLTEAKPGQYAVALRRYEHTRYERLTRVQSASDNNEIEGGNDWLLGYNPLTVPLSAN